MSKCTFQNEFALHTKPKQSKFQWFSSLFQAMRVTKTLSLKCILSPHSSPSNRVGHVRESPTLPSVEIFLVKWDHDEMTCRSIFVKKGQVNWIPSSRKLSQRGTFGFFWRCYSQMWNSARCSISEKSNCKCICCFSGAVCLIPKLFTPV